MNAEENSVADEKSVAEDRAARRFVQREFRIPILLEAGAGTGKTTVLVNRILAWVLGPGWDSLDQSQSGDRLAASVLGGVVAVTFTEAAAASMHEKVVQGLVEVARGGHPLGFAPSLEGKRSRAEILLSRIEGLRITTIHSFCRRLLAAHSLVAGIHPQYRVDAEGEIRERVIREVMERWARRVYENPGDPSALALARDGLGPEDVFEALRRLVESGVEPEDLEGHRGDEGSEVLEERWFAVLGDLQAIFQRSFAYQAPPKRMNKGLSLHYALGDLLQGRKRDAAAPTASLAIGVETLFESNLKRLDLWAQGRFTQTENRFFGAETLEVTRGSREIRQLGKFIRRLDPTRFNHVRGVLTPLLAKVRTELRAQGALSFDDLLRKAVRLLDSSDLAAVVRRSIAQLLVDEFQDTSDLQCRLIHRLAFEGRPEDRPGLFLVGDPKQSVYGWRNADLASYDRFCQGVKDRGGEQLLLSVNFRSVDPILREVKRVVQPLMRRQVGVQPSFQPLYAHRGENTDSDPAVEFWCARNSEGQRATSALAQRQEATYMAMDLRRLAEGEEDWNWSKAAILLRTNTQLQELTEALQEAEIPYILDRDRQYHRRREVVEVYALVRALLDPADHLALLAVLRSALVGVPDRVLESLWKGGLPAGFYDLRPPDFPSEKVLRGLVERVGEEFRGRAEVAEVPEWWHALLAFVTLVIDLRRSYATDPVDRFVDKIRRGTLVETFEASRFLGAWRAANLQHFFRNLESRLEEGESARELLRRLDRDLGENREVQPQKPGGSKEAVSILTIHRAKGLDFDHVYLLQIQAQVQGSAPRGQTRVQNRDGVWSLELMGVPEPSFWEVEERDRAIRRAEAIRLLYVALTRAKNRVVISGSWNLEGKAKEAKSFADLLKHRVSSGKLNRWLGETTDSDFARVDSDGVKWIALDAATASVRDRPEGEHQSLSEASPEVDAWLANLESEHQELEDRKTRARVRMNRPLRGAASEAAHHRLEVWLAKKEEQPVPGEGPVSPQGSLDREIAFEVGSAVHEALENLELSLERKKGESQLLVFVESYLERSLPPESLAEANARARSILQGFLQSPLWPRLRALGPHVMGREVDVLLPPEGDRGPLGALVGSVDLLYRDPQTGRPVVVDYKTDRIESEEDFRQRVEAYGEQTKVYQLALQSAMDLPVLPRAELWFLALGRIG